jgi:HEAT repeat protein
MSRWAKSALPILVEVMPQQDGQFETRFNPRDLRGGFSAALSFILKDLGPQAQAHIPSVVPLLDSTDPITRWWAIEAFGYVGPDAATAIPALQKALQDAEGYNRDAAAEALERIDQDALVVGLRDALRAQGGWGRVDAAEHLRKLGPAARSAVPSLLEACRDKEHAVREAARSALRQIDPDAAQTAKD